MRVVLGAGCEHDQPVTSASLEGFDAIAKSYLVDRSVYSVHVWIVPQRRRRGYSRTEMIWVRRVQMRRSVVENNQSEVRRQKRGQGIRQEPPTAGSTLAWGSRGLANPRSHKGLSPSALVSALASRGRSSRI